MSVGGQNIATYDSGGSGPAVFLLHGNSSSSETFQAQFEGDFGKKYRVVGMDLPGHGKSDDAADPENTYNVPGYSAILVEVAQKLGVADGVFFGWSLGGHIVLEAHESLPDAKGFGIFGTPPLAYPPDMESAFLPNPNMAFAFAGELTQEQIEGFAAAQFAADTSLDLAPHVADMTRTDNNARAFMGASIAPGNYTDELEILKKISRPLAVLHAEQDQLVNLDYIKGLEMPTLWRSEVQVIAGSGHTPQTEASEAFSALVGAFVDEMNG